MQDLEHRAGAQSDTQAAAEMQQAKEKLFTGFWSKRSA